MSDGFPVARRKPTSFTRPKGPGNSATRKVGGVGKRAAEIQGECEALRSRLTQKHHELCETNDQLETANKEAARREEQMTLEVNSIRKDHGILSSQVSGARTLQSDLQAAIDEKALLQIRHDALTVESQSLQHDLAKARRTIQQLEGDLNEEKEVAGRRELDLRAEVEKNVGGLSREIRQLEQQLEHERREAAQRTDELQRQLRSVKHEKEDLARRVTELQRSSDLNRDGKEASSALQGELRKAAESEQQRHEHEEERLKTRIRDLEADCENKHARLQQSLADLNDVKVRLVDRDRSKVSADERILALEDEVDVLQGSIEEDASRAKKAIACAKQDAQKVTEQLHSEQKLLSELRTDHENALAEISRLTTRERESLRAQEAHAAAQVQLRGCQSERQKLERLQAAHVESLKEVESLRSIQLSETRLKSAHALLKSQLDQLRQERDALQVKLEDLEADLHDTKYAQRAAASGTPAQPQGHPVARHSDPGHVEQEISLREEVGTLKREKAELEGRLHRAQAEAAAAKANPVQPFSPDDHDHFCRRHHQTPVIGSELKIFFAESRQSDQNALRRIADVHKLSEAQFASLEQQRAQLEHQLSQLKLEEASQTQGKDDTAALAPRLHCRIQELEEKLRSSSAEKTTSLTTAKERRDLHEMVKVAKLEAEDLRIRLKKSATRLDEALAREDELRSQLSKVRSESRSKQNKASALSDELGDLHCQYEQIVRDVAAKQKRFEEERGILLSRAASAAKDGKMIKKLEQKAESRELQHTAELRELSKQTQRLRMHCKRMEGFRENLIFEKRYLQRQVEMFQAWYDHRD